MEYAARFDGRRHSDIRRYRASTLASSSTSIRPRCAPLAWDPLPCADRTAAPLWPRAAQVRLLSQGSNGTFINGQRQEAERYIELLEKDVLRFGYSSREFVLLHDKSGS